MDCIVIGGGLSGLASAVWLAEKGHQVTLLERRGALGGRTISIPQEEVNDVPDNGQHVFASGFEHLMNYLESVGTRQYVAFPGQMTVRLPGGGTRISAFGGLEGLRAMLGDLPGVKGLDKVRTAIAQTKLMRDVLFPPKDIDSLTADQWLQRIGMPETARLALWDGIVIGLTGDKPTLSSARVPIDLLRTGIRQARKFKQPISIGYPTTDLDTLYVKSAEQTFARLGVKVRTRAPVAKVNIEQGALKGVTLLDGEFIAADAVISAVPVWQLKGLLEDLPEKARYEQAVEALKPVPIVSVNYYFDRDIGMQDWGEILLGGEGVLEQIWDRQRMHGRKPNPHYFFSTTVSASYELIHGSNAEIVAQQLAMIHRYFPESRRAKLVHSHIVRMPTSTIRQAPGSKGVRPPQKTSVPRFAVAGDWTDTDWTITMEGACQSAQRAVQAVLADA